MIGYEWTSVPGGNNLHRNVLFRDGKDKADQILPFSSWQSEDPEKLWEWMAKYEAKTGGKMLAIPHNANLSNGRMFELVDFAGNPLSKDYAERRARWEVLQEMMQTKGNSETHPLMSPNDEFGRLRHRGLGVRQPHARRRAPEPGDDADQRTSAAACCAAWSSSRRSAPTRSSSASSAARTSTTR